MAWDEDKDGLIENGGFPDQTYDCWVMSGPRYEYECSDGGGLRACINIPLRARSFHPSYREGEIFAELFF